MTSFAAVLERGCGRCLFRNECLQAHLVGLKPADCPMTGRLARTVTLVVAYGEAEACVAGRVCRLREGERLSVEAECAFELRTEGETDLLVILDPQPASSEV